MAAAGDWDGESQEQTSEAEICLFKPVVTTCPGRLDLLCCRNILDDKARTFLPEDSHDFWTHFENKGEDTEWGPLQTGMRDKLVWAHSVCAGAYGSWGSIDDAAVQSVGTFAPSHAFTQDGRRREWHYSPTASLTRVTLQGCFFRRSASGFEAPDRFDYGTIYGFMPGCIHLSRKFTVPIFYCDPLSQPLFRRTTGVMVGWPLWAHKTKGVLGCVYPKNSLQLCFVQWDQKGPPTLKNLAAAAYLTSHPKPRHNLDIPAVVQELLVQFNACEIGRPLCPVCENPPDFGHTRPLALSYTPY